MEGNLLPQAGILAGIRIISFESIILALENPRACTISGRTVKLVNY
jgi:hypothetical protein